MSGVVSQTNKRENPVFKFFANFSCLENYRLYGIVVVGFATNQNLTDKASYVTLDFNYIETDHYLFHIAVTELRITSGDITKILMLLHMSISYVY